MPSVLTLTENYQLTNLDNKYYETSDIHYSDTKD